MQAAQKTFISSTFWTERIGPSAALKTLEIMERTASWEIITNMGKKISKGWRALSKKYELDLQTWGLPALSGFTFNLENHDLYKTFISQEMMKKGFLSSNAIYVSTEHTQEIVENYFSELDPLFGVIKDCENGDDIESMLLGPVCHTGFKRLN